MAFESLIADALGHAGGGVVFALADHILYRAANPAADRLERKRAALEAMERILDADPALGEGPREAAARTPGEFARDVATVRDHLVATGRLRRQGSGARRLLESLRTLTRRERINPLSPMGKLGVATLLELLYDSGFWMGFYAHEWQMSPIAAFSTNLYQIPCFWAGLVAGAWLCAGPARLFRPREERRMDGAIEELLRETPILERVVRYETPAEVRTELEAGAETAASARLTRGGRRMLAAAERAAQRLSQAARGSGADAEQAELEAMRRRYREIRERYRGK